MAHVSLGFAERKQESRGLKGDAKFHFRLGEEGGRDFMGVIEDPETVMLLHSRNQSVGSGF